MYVVFFNDTATTEIYTLSLHDALPIFALRLRLGRRGAVGDRRLAVHGDREALARDLDDVVARDALALDRKSTRLNSSHANISYAVFCLKKNRLQLDCCHITFISYNLQH